MQTAEHYEGVTATGGDAVQKRAILSPEAEQQLWASYNTHARARIIEAYQPLVFYIYGRLGVQLGEDGVDVISEGTVGLIQAVDNFDYRRGVPFKSYAYLRIKGAMIDYLRAQKIAVRGGELREFEFFSSLAAEGGDKVSLDRLEYIFAHLKSLSPREAEIVVGMYRDGKNQREIAAMLKCTAANVSILHGRAITRLKKLVNESRRSGSGGGFAWLNLLP